MKTGKGRNRGESIYQEKMSTRQGTRTSRIPMTTQETRLKKQDRAGRACYLSNNSLINVIIVALFIVICGLQTILLM